MDFEKLVEGTQMKPIILGSESLLGFVNELNIDSLRGVNIVFVNMPLRETAKPNTPPQGPGLMAARLRMYGAKVSIIDLNAYRIQDELSTSRGLPLGRHLTQRETVSLIEAHFNHHGEPHIVALSGMITTLRWQIFVASEVRRLCRDAFIISGGGLATEIRSGLLDWIPDLDAIAHSEGDDIILFIANDVKRALSGIQTGTVRERVSKLDRLPCRELYGNGIVYHGGRPKDLDALPFAAWDLLHEDVYGNNILEWYIETPVWGGNANNSSATSFTMHRSLTSVSSRGCPYACRFCFRGAQGERDYGMRSAENLAAEIDWLVRTYDIDFLGMPDDNFAISVPRINMLPRVFKDSGIDIRWGTHLRLDEADSRLEKMREAGCIYIGFGAESASARTLESMGKGGFILRPKGAQENQFTRIGDYDFPTTMVNGVRNCWSLGIHANCTWIMGYPKEGLQELKTSVAFIMWQIEEATRGMVPGSIEWQTAFASINRKMFMATAYPGTEMCRNPKVQTALKDNFGLSFELRGTKVEPVVDQKLFEYVLELDDATKVMHGKDGRPLYYGDMDLDRFLEARQYVDEGRPEKILNMTE